MCPYLLVGLGSEAGGGGLASCTLVCPGPRREASVTRCSSLVIFFFYFMLLQNRPAEGMKNYIIKRSPFNSRFPKGLYGEARLSTISLFQR